MYIIQSLFENPPKRARFTTRKITLEDNSTIIYGVSGSGKTALVLNYLHTLNKKRFLYIDLNDLRLNEGIKSEELNDFCKINQIDVLAIENYIETLTLPSVNQILLTSYFPLHINGFQSIKLMGLDFEEFIAFDTRFENLQESLSHYLKHGNSPELLFTHESQHTRLLQSTLKLHLNDIEVQIMIRSAQESARKITAHQMFTKIKLQMKTSKDSFYKSFEALQKKGYIYLIEKFEQPRASKKIFMYDFRLQSILSFKKDFNITFSNLIVLELIKLDLKITYTDEVDFYIYDEKRAILVAPFLNHEQLDVRLHKLDEMINNQKVKKIEIVTMNREQHFKYKNIECDIAPFTQWALID